MLTKLFGFNPNTSTIRTEVVAGITTFLTMAYILAVNPAVLCETGMDKGALFTTTALMAAIATMMMATIAKLPFALAPGMGLNAFFAYTICLGLGYSWQFALTAVFIEGIIFILLTVTNLREMIVYCLSDSIKNAISVGIGMFIAYIGLQNSGIIVSNSATQVTLGGLGSATPILTIVGTILTAILLVKRVKGALLIGILAITLIGIPCGVTTMQGIISTPPSIEPIFFKLEWSNIFTTDMLIVVSTLLFLDLFDTIGTLVGVCNKANIYTPDGKIPRLKEAFMVDAIATTLGSIMGTSTVTTFAESATGVSEGGRSGITAAVTSLCFLAALIFAPLFLSIPSAATAPVLIIVAVMMMESVTKIDFANFADAVPAFICIIMMPLSYSISNGIIFGHLAFVAINLCTGNHKRVSTGMIVLAVIFLLRFLL